MSQPDPSGNRGPAGSTLVLRRGVGFLGLALPVVLTLGKIWLDGGGIQGSISAYYYTVMGDYFVGTNFAMAALLASYRYRREDTYLAGAVAAFAVGIALFPTTAAGTSPTTTQSVVAFVHLICATMFFLGMACFSFFLFTRTDPHVPATPQKLRRNVVYRACGIVIVACLALVVVANSILSGPMRDQIHPVFWLESVAVWAFAAAWLVKGELFLKDQPERG